ncbi:hypothetical protein GI374_08560 [Paracoccus sp. S-4012]|uniref:hypothetical protein n=1 Tax=Paracoccus sp. S-4012 TaxID=2665648 RepID=UPI0012B0D78E|nr:hypothetical protein [Paracoccus sp. S-4012]MRX50491.1 hypothetical protein [Paracoccus sp. S-4012]
MTDHRNRRLWLILYPTVTFVVWINFWMLALIGPALGLPVLSPTLSLILSPLLGLPATALAVRWVRGLLDEAEE